MCLELVDPAVPLLAELTVEGLAGFAGGLCLCKQSEYGTSKTERLLVKVCISDMLGKERHEVQNIRYFELAKQQPAM